MKFTGLFLFILLFGTTTYAVERTAQGMSLAEQLGTAGGLAYACKAGKSLEDFEVIASRLLANKAETETDEKAAYEAYATAKFRAMKLHEKEHQMSCGEILARFKNMEIFKFVVYADGSIKMNDGTVLHPKRPIPKPKTTKEK